MNGVKIFAVVCLASVLPLAGCTDHIVRRHEFTAAAVKIPGGQARIIIRGTSQKLTSQGDRGPRVTRVGNPYTMSVVFKLASDKVKVTRISGAGLYTRAGALVRKLPDAEVMMKRSRRSSFYYGSYTVYKVRLRAAPVILRLEITIHEGKGPKARRLEFKLQPRYRERRRSTLIDTIMSA